MTAIFMSFSRNGKRSRKRKTEITGKYNRKALADGWIEQARRRKVHFLNESHFKYGFSAGLLVQQEAHAKVSQKDKE